MVDSPGLENRYSFEQTIEGSNPSLSFFCSLNRLVSLWVLPELVSNLFFLAWLGGIVEPEKRDWI